jgi:hypothetical protein
MPSTPERAAWQNMIKRCANGHPDYGGRGIRVCERWASFENFMVDMGPRPPGHSLHRVDSEGGYTPENCKWATRVEQARAQRNNRRVTIGGVTHTVSEWAEIRGLPQHTLSNRLRAGCSEDGLLAPSRSKPRVLGGCYKGRKSNTPEHAAWTAMKQRCSNPKHQAWTHYGGRGITFCERWASYDAFLADMGLRPSAEHSLDRIDVNGPYSPDNCRWATRIQQARNSRKVHILEHNGIALTLSAWAERVGISSDTIRNRLRSGWTVEASLTRPLR